MSQFDGLSTDPGICYCGRPMVNERHTTGDPFYCYEEEADFDEESRCVAMLDPDQEEE